MTLVDWPRGVCKVELPKSIAPGKTGTGVVKLTKEGVDTEFEKSFTLQLNDEMKSRFTVPIKRTIRTPGATNTATKQSNESTGH